MENPFERIKGAQTQSGRVRTSAWFILAIVSCFWVVLLNGQPLYYYDSKGYLEAGIKALSFFGLVANQPVGGEAASTAAASSGDGIINGSRSVVYSLFSASAAYWLKPLSVPFFHMVVTVASLALLLRIALRGIGPATRPFQSTLAMSTLAAGLGSLPFFVAYFMPDILTGLLLLAIAVSVVAWKYMLWWEALLVVALGILAVLSHPSHLLIAAGMLPVVILASIWANGWRWWGPVLMVVILVTAGVSEKFALSAIAKEELDAEVNYYPFLTVRLIEDGTGYAYLQEHCPDEALATCALYQALQQSDDPMRLTASHMMFEVVNAKLGSLRLLPEETQSQIAAEQMHFAMQTFKAHPVRITKAAIRNTLIQARMSSIRMNIAYPETVQFFESLPYFEPGLFRDGRLVVSRDWVAAVDILHYGYYTICLVVLAMLAFWPGRLRPEGRVFILLVLTGILANAFVCGAISQPADRYGARVIWLLPFLTMLALLLRPPPEAK